MKSNNKNLLEKYIEQVKENTWIKDNNIIKILTQDNIIEIEGYIVNSYKCIDAVCKVLLNGEILYSEDIVTFEEFNERDKEQYNRFRTDKEALNYIYEILKDKDYKVVYE